MLRVKQEHLHKERELIRARSIHATGLGDLLVSCGAVILLSLVLFPLVDHDLLLFWLLANGGIFWYRYGRIRSFRKLSPSGREKVSSFLTSYFSGILLSGFFFGSAGFVLFPYDSVSRQLLLAAILWGASAISLDSSASSLGISLLYSLFMVLPVTLTSLFSGGSYHLLLGIMGVIYLGAQFFFSIKLNRFFRENLDLQMDNLALTSELIREVSNRISVENIMKTSKFGNDA